MSRLCFLDTFAALAMLSPSDSQHRRVLQWLAASRRPMVTTSFVLIEVADALASRRTRGRFATFMHGLERDPRTTIATATEGLFRRALALYNARSDRDWSLTDCASFVVMQDMNITVTADHHFTQAGFVALFE